MPKKTKQDDQISEEQVWDVIEFAKQMNKMNPGIFTPDLVNARLKDINLNPLKSTSDEIDKALTNPKQNEQALIGIGDFFEMTDMLYKRQLYMFGNLPSWDLTFTCINAKKEDYSSAAYKKDEKIVFDFLNRFNVKNEFRKALKNMFRRETYYSVLRDDEEQYILQELPHSYCQISGLWERGLLFDFNMQLFMTQSGVSLDQYPDVFKKYYKRVVNVAKNNKYDPGVKVENRNGSWQYWVQTDPATDNVWCWKLNPETFTNVPFFSPLFPDLVLRPFIRKLQTNQFIIQASKVLIGLIGFNKDNKSGNVKDAFQVSPEVAGQFANLIRQGLAKEIQFGLGPFSDIKSFEFKADGDNMLDQFNKVVVGQSGNNARLLYATDKMNAEESKSSLSIDEQIVLAVYPQFEDFLNFHINKRCKKFKFKFNLEGTEMPSNRQKRLDNAISLAQLGVVLPQKFSASIGMQYDHFIRQMEMAQGTGVIDLFKPLQTSYTMANDGGGRPQKNSNELSDSGVQTRDDGSNVARGGDV